MKAVIFLFALVAVAAADWSIIAKNLLTTETCVAFVNEQEGFVAGDSSGAGPQILKTEDGGNTWTPRPAAFGIDILLLSCDAADKTVVVSSIAGELYSTDDGGHFNKSKNGGLSQDVRFVGVDGDGGKKFATAGGHWGIQGVGLSTDGGQSFTHYNAHLFTFARYVALPSDRVWYVAAGAFPTPPPPPPGPPPANGRASRKPRRPRTSVFQDENGRFVTHPPRSNVGDGTGYQAQLAKTSDGGKTWTTLFAQNNTFYFNGIDCNPSNPNHCCVAAEADDGPAAGARIMCTEDGQNFNTTFTAPATSGESLSLMQIRFVNSTFAWAAGGDLTSVAPKAWFLSTNDGGRTWQHNTKELYGYYAFGLSVLSDSAAFAAVDDLITQSSGVAAYKP